MPQLIPANSPIFVFFAHDPVSARAVPVSKPAIAVVSNASDWNDFSFRFGADLIIMPASGAAITVSARVMFSEFSSTAAAIAQQLGSRAWIEYSEVSLPFCSILEDMDSYRAIVGLLGFESAVSGLRKLGDAVVLRTEGVNVERLSLINSDSFHLGALRHEGTFVAFRRGARFLRPQPIAEVEDAAVSFKIRAMLPSADNFYDIHFEFDPDSLDRNRMSVLIGRNGTGKTQFLLSLIDGLQAESDTNPLTHPIVFSSRPACNRLLVFSSVASDQYPRSIPPWAGIDYQYFSMISGGGSEEDALTTSLIDCIRDDNKILFVASNDTGFEIPFVPRGRMAILERALETLRFGPLIYLPLNSHIDDPDLPDTVLLNGRLYFPLARAGRLNEKRKLLLTRMVSWSEPPVVFGLGPKPRSLSSGELAMLRFAAQASGSAEMGCIFLFDEPETHLHPNFISDFMSLLHVILDVTRSIAIIVTHSAYVVREVPRSRVHILSLERRTVSIDRPRLQTFGASIDSISEFVFADTNISHQYQETLEKWLADFGPDITIEAIVEKYGSDMNSETLSFVAHLLRSRSQ